MMPYAPRKIACAEAKTTLLHPSSVTTENLGRSCGCSFTPRQFSSTLSFPGSSRAKNIAEQDIELIEAD